jgi:hypothetical protein
MPLAAVSQQSTAPDDDYVPIMVVLNKTRLKLHEAQMRLVCEQLQEQRREPPILLNATYQPIRRKNDKRPPPKLSRAETNYIRSLSDDKLDRLPPVFYLYEGAYVLFTHNTALKYGIANGTRGRILGHQFPEGTTFTNATYKGMDVRIPLQPAEPVDAFGNTPPRKEAKVDFVLVEVLSAATLKKAPNQPKGLPRNVIAVPIMSHAVKKNIQLPASAQDNKRKAVGLTVTQVPLRQAAVLTNYSIQGNQYKRFIIAEAKPSQFYIPFSRGKRGLNSLILRVQLNPTFVSKAKPSKDLKAAVATLRSLHDSTKQRVAAHTVH